MNVFGFFIVVLVASSVPVNAGCGRPEVADRMAANAACPAGVPEGVSPVPLTVGPLAALQTVFALDFARRAGVLSAPRQ